ncbi:MAG: hypothetical protein NXI13_00600 [Proteobacteria bacterium]|nr:hypothetical protein [Pseudomonadota bacterium]
MKSSRREFLKFFSWAASLPLVHTFLGKAHANSLAGSKWREDSAVHFFEKLGYRPLPAMPLITGDVFNGGVRFDESGPLGYENGRTMGVQNCIRMEDMDAGNTPGSLPYFHILFVNIKEPISRGHILTQGVDYLANDAGLDARKLVFVSTPHFEPYVSGLETFSILPSQFIARDKEQAVSQGDGSGYFAPNDHPHATPYFSVSIHYPHDLAAVGQELTYPLTGYLELAEVMIDQDASEIQQAEGIGFGLERLNMAMGEPVDSIDQSRKSALVELEDEAARRNVTLPLAYEKLKSS